MDEVRINPLAPILGPYNPMPQRLRRNTKPENDSDDDFSEDARLLGLFKGRKLPNYRIAWEMYQKGLGFNQQINLDETVRVNENFFIGILA